MSCIKSIISFRSLIINSTSCPDSRIIFYCCSAWYCFAERDIVCHIRSCQFVDRMIDSRITVTIILKVKNTKLFTYRIKKRHWITYITNIRFVISRIIVRFRRTKECCRFIQIFICDYRTVIIAASSKRY